MTYVLHSSGFLNNENTIMNGFLEMSELYIASDVPGLEEEEEEVAFIRKIIALKLEL